MTTATIRKWYERPIPIPTDFIGTEVFTERIKILRKEEGVSLPIVSGFVPSAGYTHPAYFIFVMTKAGDLRIEVTKTVFELLRKNDPIVVSYRTGRWTGAIEGKIAR